MPEEPLDNISLSLKNTLMKSDLTSVTIDLAELGLDSLINEAILKNIPILSTLVGVGKTVQTVRDQLFLKKIIYFISEVGSIPQEERGKIINEIDQDEKVRIKVGEKLLYIIDKSEDHKSAEIIAKLFTGFLKREMSYDEFLKASVIINNIFIDDLLEFVKTEKYWHSKAREVGGLLNSGLYDINIEEVEVEVRDYGTNERNYTNSKYKTDIRGGELETSISEIGEIIKRVLKGRV